MENNTRRRPVKKRYLAIAALSVLTVTGGAIGATVTAQSTIANNQITITKKQTPATVTASGTPITIKFEEGTSIANSGYGGPGGNTVITLTNTGTTDATVRVKKLDNVKIPGGSDMANFVVGGDGNGPGQGSDKKEYFTQRISGNSADWDKVFFDEPITVPGGGSKKLVAYINFGSQAGTANFTAYEKTFDIKFDYVNKS
ncbi:hypothetical protein K8F61_13310 [Microbacterium resistens]|uniref:Uncharacterized protein n=1 Tax=Microbacterium resistens TaxID=156977 RepID=A0ABY3RNV4_9MICO|nr:hypothetical protein [Microbacterium resistens]UGS25644.1 hypothetical protein K8F61_13310 [Microbacterium resistens]